MADLVAEGDQFVEHSIGAAGDHHRLKCIIDLCFDFRLCHFIRFSCLATHLCQCEEIAEVKTEHAILRVDVCICFLVRLGDKNAARDAPSVAVRLHAELVAGVLEANPLRADKVAWDEIPGNRDPISASCQLGCSRPRTTHRVGDRWEGLLQWLAHGTYTEVGDNRVRDRQIPEFALEFVGRIMGPDVFHDIDCFHHHPAALASVQMVEQLRVA